ncbi:DNA-directed DNA polymerase II small subunit [Natronococcus sp. A-GB1]|uniref:DNA-directed DNA polymerase II small subunit n=1 Tax=Natronococcus sp. A-GB1 TaxID=3037648 RepID=UPI00241F72B9|nr:DNA-directed DNA polymerase II small subunit [Natronococcus sp. A-GB1]MDG5758312.1 DNA-directed DNA polymerase II small subunit [Natronococcus sp. A-GB1]
MPLEGPARIVSELTSRGYNAEREAVTRIAATENPATTLEAVLEDLPDDALVVRSEHVDSLLERAPVSDGARTTDPIGSSIDNGSDSRKSPTDDGSGSSESSAGDGPDSGEPSIRNTSASTGDEQPTSRRTATGGPVETKGDLEGSGRSADPLERSLEIAGDMTGESTGTGEYGDFVSVFRDRLERLGSKLRGRVNHRPATAIQSMPGGSEAGMVGLVNDVRSTASGHWLIELEDATGTFPWLVMKDREYADLVNELLYDEVLAMEGTLADDSGIAFVDSMYFPDVPRTHEPSTADRHVQAALISDVHVGSQEFMSEAWNRFADWLHTPEAQHVEYVLIAGDMVEGVGVYPNQDEELDVVDIYEQYEAFNERLKQVPGDIEIVMIPGNHDAVRLAEPQPGFDEELREIMSAHDARIVSNPSTVTLEGVSVLMYHGVSLDEVIAELPEEKASYDEPHRAMYQLLKKRHVAPQFGGHTRLAPEEKDYLIMEEVPDIFHTGHVHKLGFGKYHNVLAINSGCWQSQTDFQKSVNIQPDAGFAPIVDLDTLNVTVQKFS